MSRKRRAESLSEPDEDESSDTLSSDSEVDSDDGSSGDEAGKEELVNCDFEFFDPQKQDFLGIRHLLRQLFDDDDDSFDLAGLAEMVLAQPLVGTTVKTEGNESDPLAFLTVLNLRIHKVRTRNNLCANLIG
jgi:protein BCP1